MPNLPPKPPAVEVIDKAVDGLPSTPDEIGLPPPAPPAPTTIG